MRGKNFKYRQDDKMAIDAEIGARKKGHPNFFTDTDNMIRQVLSLKNKLIAAQAFLFSTPKLSTCPLKLSEQLIWPK